MLLIASAMISAEMFHLCSSNSISLKLAEVVGFEPTHDGIKTRCRKPLGYTPVDGLLLTGGHKPRLLATFKQLVADCKLHRLQLYF